MPSDSTHILLWFCGRRDAGPVRRSHYQPCQNAEESHLEGLETTKTVSKLLEQVLARAAPRIDQVIDDELNKMWSEKDCYDCQCNDEKSKGHSEHSHCSPHLRDSKL